MGIRHCANTVTKTSSKVRKGVGIRREGMLQLFARAVTKDTKGGVRKKRAKQTFTFSFNPTGDQKETHNCIDRRRTGSQRIDRLIPLASSPLLG